MLLPEVDDVEVVSIVPRESSMSGVIRYGVDDDREATGLHTQRRLKQQIVHALAPQAGEELLYGACSRASRAEPTTASRLQESGVLPSLITTCPRQSLSHYHD
jgi:ATP-dependent Zn protease